MVKGITSFNANNEVLDIIKEVKEKGDNISAFVNQCILNSQKPKPKPKVTVTI